jgi:hypothetical protein
MPYGLQRGGGPYGSQRKSLMASKRYLETQTNATSQGEKTTDPPLALPLSAPKD